MKLPSKRLLFALISGLVVMVVFGVGNGGLILGSVVGVIIYLIPLRH